MAATLFALAACGRQEQFRPCPTECPVEGDQELARDPVQHLGRAESPTFIEILDLTFEGDRVYGCNGTRGLSIWDVSGEGEYPLRSMEVAPEGLSDDSFPRCQHVVVNPTNKDQILITNRGDEIQPTPWVWLYDAQSATDPQPLAGWSGTSSIEGVVWAPGGERFYAAAHGRGMVAMERQNDTLVIVGEDGDDSSDAWQPALFDDATHLFVAEGNTGLRTYGLDDPQDPELIHTLPLPGSARDVILTTRGEQRLALVASSGSVVIVDVTDAEQPSIVGEANTPGTALTTSLLDDNTLVVAEWDRVRAYDITDLENPLPLWSENVPTDDDFSRVLTADVDPEGRRVFAGEWRGMHVFAADDEVNAPDMAVFPDTLQFGKQSTGSVEQKVVVVENRGNAPLVVRGGTAFFDFIRDDATCTELEPAEKMAIEVELEVPDEDRLLASLGICSNDPDESEFEVQITANVPGRGVGDPVPEFELPDLDGVIWSNTDTEGKVAVLAYFATF